MSQRPEDLLQALRRAGFDATRKASSLTVVQPPHPDFPDAVRSRQLLSGIVYIPQHPSLHGPALARLISLIRNMETPVTP